MKKNLLILLFIGTFLTFLLGCKKNKSSDFSEEPCLNIGNCYRFDQECKVGEKQNKSELFGKGREFWYMIIESKNVIKIYSENIKLEFTFDINNLNELESSPKLNCVVEYKYKYDPANRVFEILGKGNNTCFDVLVGKWKYRSGGAGPNFYFEKINGVMFDFDNGIEFEGEN